MTAGWVLVVYLLALLTLAASLLWLLVNDVKNESWDELTATRWERRHQEVTR